jgi:hypothetical protein
MAMEAIGAFRDAISISSVVHNRTNTIIYGHARTNQYSTFFDFYAWVFSKDFNLLTTNNPSLAGLDEFKDFKGQSTAGLPTSRWDGLEFDETLLKAVFGEWPRRFSNPSPAWRSLALFRSLNMAHAAAQVPGFVDLTAQSLGRSVALWISAFEILTTRRTVMPDSRKSTASLRTSIGAPMRVSRIFTNATKVAARERTARLSGISHAGFTENFITPGMITFTGMPLLMIGSLSKQLAGACSCSLSLFTAYC